MKVTLLDIGIMWDKNGIYFYRLSEKFIFADSQPTEDGKGFGKTVLQFINEAEDSRRQDKLAS